MWAGRAGRAARKEGTGGRYLEECTERREEREEAYLEGRRNVGRKGCEKGGGMKERGGRNGERKSEKGRGMRERGEKRGDIWREERVRREEG